MYKWIALFRGINVGGKNPVSMKDLVASLEPLGLENVRTYIRSGNVVFQSSAELTQKNRMDMYKRIVERMQSTHGFRPHVLILAPAGVGRSKLAAGAEKWIGVPTTTRNWRTVQKLRELSEAAVRG